MKRFANAMACFVTLVNVGRAVYTLEQYTHASHQKQRMLPTVLNGVYDELLGDMTSVSETQQV